jgi:hypothetical protein
MCQSVADPALLSEDGPLRATADAAHRYRPVAGRPRLPPLMRTLMTGKRSVSAVLAHLSRLGTPDPVGRTQPCSSAGRPGRIVVIALRYMSTPPRRTRSCDPLVPRTPPDEAGRLSTSLPPILIGGGIVGEGVGLGADAGVARRWRRAVPATRDVEVDYRARVAVRGSSIALIEGVLPWPRTAARRSHRRPPRRWGPSRVASSRLRAPGPHHPAQSPCAR